MCSDSHHRKLPSVFRKTPSEPFHGARTTSLRQKGYVVVCLPYPNPRSKVSVNMDKKKHQKGKSNVSPTLLTPCRPVGLRRKRPGVKNTDSPSLNLSAVEMTSPVMPVNTGLIKTRVLTDQIAPLENVEEHFGKSGEEHNLRNEERTSIKRKYTTPSSSSIPRRKIAPRNCSNSPTSPKESTRNGTPLVGHRNGALGKNEENYKISAETSRDRDTVTSCEADISHSHSAHVFEESLANRVITAMDIHALQERIASKEKKLREQKLATLYKKKHDPKQVAKEIDCWLQGCKGALHDLQSELAKRGQSYSLIQLLQTLGIPPSLIDLDEDDSE